jgi:hypothetical protein
MMSFLRRLGEGHRTNRAESGRRRIAADDAYKLDDLRRAYDEMGSADDDPPTAYGTDRDALSASTTPQGRSLP